MLGRNVVEKMYMSNGSARRKKKAPRRDVRDTAIHWKEMCSGRG